MMLPFDRRLACARHSRWLAVRLDLDQPQAI
jgi:hypothetical protein